MRLLLPLLLSSCSAAASSSLPGPISAAVERVIDGDTFKARAAIWIDQDILVSVRLAGADTPELARPLCPTERKKAEAAQAFTAAFLGGRAILRDIRHDKYAGRVVARVENAAGADLAEALIERGLAAPGESAAWCPTS
jgi:endonuclease YncB( thermonuclease family)